MTVLNDKVYSLLNELNSFSSSTYQHAMRVAIICCSFGERLGLDEEEIEKLKIGGLLHDIGKLWIPDAILNKPSKLSFEEYEIVKNHSKYGIDLLNGAGFSDQDVLDMVLHHHERIDGKGYPCGLKGNSIPKLARILSICDCFDAMRSKRLYSENKDLDYIRKELLDNSGTQFDENYVNLFLPYLDEMTSIERMKKIM